MLSIRNYSDETDFSFIINSYVLSNSARARKEDKAIMIKELLINSNTTTKVLFDDKYPDIIIG